MKTDKHGLSLAASAHVIILAVFVGFLAGYDLGDKHGEHRAVSELRPEIDAKAAEIIVLNERIMAIAEAYSTTGLASFYSYPFHGATT